MLPAEVQRILLLVGLAATAYLMMLAWTEDYGQSGVPETYNQAPVVDATNNSSLPEGESFEEVLDETGTLLSIESDLPDDSLIAPADNIVEDNRSPTTLNANTGSAVERLVHIKTDVLDLWIDRLGGDIVRIQLPKYPINLETLIYHTYCWIVAMALPMLHKAGCLAGMALIAPAQLVHFMT